MGAASFALAASGVASASRRAHSTASSDETLTPPLNSPHLLQCLAIGAIGSALLAPALAWTIGSIGAADRLCRWLRLLPLGLDQLHLLAAGRVSQALDEHLELRSGRQDRRAHGTHGDRGASGGWV